MKCAKIDCCFEGLDETSPCGICGRQVHYLCSNDLYNMADLSRRFCSPACVSTFLGNADASGELTPSSISGISASSQATVIDLAQSDMVETTAPLGNIPASVGHHAPDNTTDSIWTVVHVLDEPVKYRRKTFTHICLICAETKLWQRCLCKTAHASNAKSHALHNHPEHTISVKEVSHRKQRSQRFMVEGSSKRPAPEKEAVEGSPEEKQPGKRQKIWWQSKPRQDFISGHITRWLIRDRLPYNMVTTTAFRELVAALTGDPDVTILASETYNCILDNHYEKYLGDTRDLLRKEHELLHGTPFMNVMHDLWTNKSKNSIVGVSGSFIDHFWKPRHLALLAVTKTDGHESAPVAALISGELITMYGLSMETMVLFTISDTASAARKISKEFDTTLQTDCAMHALNLYLGYGIGLQESVRTQYSTDVVTELTTKKRVVVTQGGAFPEGGAVIRKLRALNNYFASSNSPQRVQCLTDIQRFHKLPQLSALLEIDVRVASASKLLQRSIVNYTAFRAYFQTGSADKTEKSVFNCITRADWDLTVEMEAIVQRVASLALVESQSASLLSSTMYVFLRVASARMNSHKISAYCLDGVRDEDTNEKNFARIEMKLEDVSVLGHCCIKRTLHQIANRLPMPSVQMGMTLLLDPRTKRAAKNYLRIPDTAEAVTDSIITETKELLLMEHRVFYRATYGDSTQENCPGNSASSSPNEYTAQCDADLDLLCGEEVSQQSAVNAADEQLNKEADAEVERWLNHRVEWAEVANHQIADETKRKEVWPKLTLRNREKKSVWNVEQLCQHIDVCKWFAEYGEKAFPSIAKVARVWLGRSSSTAFQERVFSTGSFVMSSLRTRTDNERAQRQLVLSHNRDEIERMESSKRGLW